jgi:hypothetical protein
MGRFWRSDGKRPSEQLETPIEGHGPSAEAERLRWERDQALARAARLERRRGRPVLAAVGAALLTAAAVTVGVLAVAASQGSFTAGGAAIDRQVATATAPARDFAAGAAERSGQALRQAGEDLQAEGRRLQGSAG